MATSAVKVVRGGTSEGSRGSRPPAEDHQAAWSQRKLELGTATLMATHFSQPSPQMVWYLTLGLLDRR
jgi:hypothetical protein